MDVTSVEDGKVNRFTAVDIPSLQSQIHHYSIDWDLLAQGQPGVSLQIDLDGDGDFEASMASDGELTFAEFIAGTNISGAPSGTSDDDDGGGGGVGGGGKPSASSEQRFTVVEFASGKVTPVDGGIVETGTLDRLEGSVEVPPAAVGQDTIIELTVGSSSDPGLPPMPPGSFTRVFGFLPEGLRFLATVTIVISYSDSEVDGFDENSLFPLLLTGDEWVRVQGCETIDPLIPDPCLVERDIVNNRLIINASHFSVYVVQGTSLSAPPDAMATGLMALGDNLVRVWHFNNATKEWAFYDPRPIFAESNTMKELVPGDAYFVRVNTDQTAVLNGKEHQLFAGWNLIGW